MTLILFTSLFELFDSGILVLANTKLQSALPLIWGGGSISLASSILQEEILHNCEGI